MLRDKFERVTPPLQLVSQFFEKEPITIRHNQNVADIFKYWANLRPVLLAKKVHVFATKTYYVQGFRYNFSNPVILFAKKYSDVEKENKFLVIDTKVPFAHAQKVLLLLKS